MLLQKLGARAPVLALVAAMSTTLPAPPLTADTAEPPFEMRFPQETQVTEFHSTFGVMRSGGRRHLGEDLMASKMTEVYAVADGVVTTIDTASGAGRYLIIEHIGGWSSAYMHLNNDDPGTDNGSADWSLTVAPGIEEGTWVEAGRLIAWVGDSGNAEWTAPHTHFELRLNDQAVNPYPFLVEAYTRDHARYLAAWWEVIYETGLEPMI